MKQNLIMKVSVLAVPVLVAGATACPQTVLAAAADDATGGALEEVIVTAQRRSERIQDVPSAITALDSEAISRLNLRGTEELARQVPSMTFDVLTPGESTITMRGLGTAYGLSPTVSYYLNEVPLDMRTDGYSGAPDIDLFDVDRVEVLRGPQGTLYGASAMGGAVRIITKQPDFTRFASESEFALETADGGNEGWQVKTALNVPVSDRFATRLVGTYQRVPGYVDRAEPASSFYDPHPDDPVVDENANDVDVIGGRAIAKWLLTDAVTVTPSVMYQEIRADGRGDWYSNQPEFQIATYYPEQSKSRLLVANALVEADLGPMQLLSSTSYASKDVDFDHDFSVLSANLAPLFGVPEPIPNYPTSVFDGSDNSGFIQEFRLTSSDEAARLRWVAGAYYSKFRQTSAEYIDSASFAGDIAELYGDPSLADPAIYRFDQRSEDQQTAVFGEVAIKLWPALELTAGLRGYWLETSLENTQSGLLAAPNQPHTTSSKDGVNPRIVLNYRLNDDVLVYATGARGYRPGGPNVGLPINAGCVLGDVYKPLFDPDSVWNYELGLKSQFLDRRATLNLAAYRIDWKDVQQSITDPVCGSLFFANFGDARSEGVELEISLRPIESLLLNASASYTDAKYTKVDDAFVGFVDVQPGDALSEVPEWKYAASAEYTFAIGDRRSGYVRADWQYVGSIPTGVTNRLERDSYDILNAAVGMQSGPWEVSLYVQNAGNTKGTLAILQDATATIDGVFDSRIATSPRTIGMLVRMRF